MSETLQSEVVKSVSEAGEFEFHNNNNNKPSGGIIYDNKKHANNSTKQHSNTMNSNSPRGVATTGSRSGSQFLLPSLLNANLPSKIAIILGLCQVAVGGAMVLTGILAIRYQSYMFHYGTGLWAGLFSAITGMLGAMCSKQGIGLKPSWLCGGRKWQIHVFLLALVLSLSSVILLAIFSISGLLQDAKTIMAVDYSQRELPEWVEDKNTSGIFINTILLFLSILQILLCFSSLGLAVRVMFKGGKGGLLSSKGSTGSEIAIRDGGEYHARKDHLIHWLGNQRPPSIIPIAGIDKQSMQKYSPPPSFVAIQPVMYSSPRKIIYPMAPVPRAMIQVPIQPQFSFGPPPTHLVPICSVPMHRSARGTPNPSIMPPGSRVRSHRAGSATPVSSIASLSVAAEHHNRRQRRNRQTNNIQSNAMSRAVSGLVGSSGIVMGTNMKSFQTHSISSKAPSIISAKTERSEKNNELEVTEVDVSRTYTGLDRSIADDYICAMNSRKESNATQPSSCSVTQEEREEDFVVEGDEDSETEITRM